jgi:hypothetical protein
MSIRDAVIRAITVGVTGIPVLLGGCVSASGDVQGTRLNDNLVVYAPFDNERDWGPSYLVDAPDRHWGDEVRIGDSRASPPAAGTAAADPSKPPLNSGHPQPLP